MDRIKKNIDNIRRRSNKMTPKSFMLWVLSVGILIAGIIIIWVSTLQLPDFKLFTEQKLQSSTKIYDRTGKILLYNANQDIKRTIVPYEDMGTNIKNATVAIEDSEFYNHKGIRITSIIRGTIWAKLTGKKVQGGSTITQQLIKNTLLTPERTITRKIKEWILATKLERIMSKEDILALYLNQAPYGGNIYGIAEASRSFFGKEPLDMTLAESAYMAAIPNGPTRYSPYGKNRNLLEDRKNLVLKRMFDLKFITQSAYDDAKKETVAFLPQQPQHIAAPHFVFFVRDYLINKYGEDTVDNGGLKVITTLDYDLQKQAEAVALRNAKANEKNWNGKNTAIVVIDPKTGQILSMVGSRDYFDKTIDGNFNVATAYRQPGSSFKPIVYAAAFKKGYTENTTLFDVKTEFNASCSPTGKPLPGHNTANCYMPDNYDNAFRGPMTLKNALAQSINVVAVKLLYLVGIPDALKMAHDLGISTLNDPTRYGLSLVIGGGETTLLDMTSVYGVFANNGIRNPYTSILSVQNSAGVELEKYQDSSYQVLDPNIPHMLDDILDDNEARTPTFGANSALVIPGRDVAVKTGTTNNNKDAWTIGYTPSVVVGVWVGNNENTPMKKGGAALAGPIWNEVMSDALAKLPIETFDKPNPIDPNLSPILRGYWQGANNFTNSGILQPSTGVHTILHWIDKNNPTGPQPINGANDPQYTNWEYGVQNWWEKHQKDYPAIPTIDISNTYNPNQGTNIKPILQIVGLDNNIYKKDQQIKATVLVQNQSQIKKIDIYINNTYLTSLKSYPYIISFVPNDIADIGQTNTIRAIGYNTNGGVGENQTSFLVENN